jgi:beta-galactosidase
MPAKLARLITLMAAGVAALTIAIQPVAAEGRRTTALNTDWRFHLRDAPAAERPDLDDSAWSKVSLPHTWNAADGDDGGTYFRGVGWYRRDLVLTADQTRKRLFLQFDGAALAADVFVNGVKAGRHEGGYATFRFDVTGLVRPGRNLVAVKVDDTAGAPIAPMGGDFTIYGGLYRGVGLIAAEPLHIDLMDHGGPGVRVTADQITADSAQVRVETGVRNDGAAPAKTSVRVDILDAKGRRVAGDTATFDAPAQATTPVVQTLSLPRPRLWNGRRDPYLYKVVVTLLESSRPRDSVTAPLGVRDIRVDAQKGFLLNGKPYDVHGVNIHPSARPGRGAIVTDAEIKADINRMVAMGVTGLRLAHFQHPAQTYELADRAGIIVITEAPLNSIAEDTPAFAANVRQQMAELIRQTGNHPSVAAWGVGNEVYRSDAATHALLADVAAFARTQDPTRPTFYAACCQDDLDPQAVQGVLSGYNRYYGWYSGETADIGAWADKLHGRAPDRPIGVTEYGAGASVKHQQDPPVRPKPTDKWHPEQYQALFHETYWRAFRDRPWLWAKFVWAGFDFASDGRDEGDHPGINDKGLVTYDRKTTKDAYHWYQANWTTAPMAYITSRRFTMRATPTVTVKVYANSRTARLKVDGRDLGEVTVEDHVALWKDVALKPGQNRIVVTAGKARDTVVWTFTPPAAQTASPAGG